MGELSSKAPLSIEWVEVDTSPAKKYSGVPTKTIRVVSPVKDKNSSTYSYTIISEDIIRELGWKSGDRVTLYKNGYRFFKLAKREVGLSTLSHISAKSKSNNLCIKGTVFARELLPKINGFEFEAWVQDDYILFKPKEEVKGRNGNNR